MNKKQIILKGMRDGLPIGLGYFAVSFSLGIIAKKANLTMLGGFICSLFTRASAGEYGAYTLMCADATYVEIIIMSLVTNLRYLLMSTALTQKFNPKTGLLQRILVSTCITDEIFGISIAYDGYLDPIYTYAATLVAGPMWAAGTAMGIFAGSVLPLRAVSALSVALYGMFIAIIIPPAKKDKVVLISIIASFLLSYLCSITPALSALSSGTKTIILTIAISAIVAIVKPIKIDDEN